MNLPQQFDAVCVRHDQIGNNQVIGHPGQFLHGLRGACCAGCLVTGVGKESRYQEPKAWHIIDDQYP